MPPSVRDWVPEDHLNWKVPEAVGELDLSASMPTTSRRARAAGVRAVDDGRVLLYAYRARTVGARHRARVRGGRRLPCRRRQLAPDHSTIAEFRCRHERALGEVFSGVLGLCARAGLVSVGGWRSRHEDVGQRVDQREPRLRPDHARDPRRGRGDRSARGISPTARSVATSCPSTCASARGGARSRARQGTSQPRARPGDRAGRR